MRIGSLFTGYGGLDMAVAEHYGAETAWTSDIEPNACKVIARHWPDVPNLGDIAAVDWARVEAVDILTGGFPCQDISLAGAGAGMAGKRSGLWAHMAEAIYQLRPRLVVIENVRSIASSRAVSDVERCPHCLGKTPEGKSPMRALGIVLGDLAALGYDAQWHGLRASDIGAPHGRARIFITAYPVGEGRQRGLSAARPGIPAHGQAPDDSRSEPNRRAPSDFGSYREAIERWERLTRPAPRPMIGGLVNPEFPEWMMGLPAGHVTAPELGIARTRALGVIGGGVVPQQAAAALTWLDAVPA